MFPRELLLIIFSHVPYETLQRLRTFYATAHRVPLFPSLTFARWARTQSAVEWLHQCYHHFTLEHIRANHNALITTAVQCGNLELLQWMFARYPELTVEDLRAVDAVCIAAVYDQRAVLQWMLKRFPELSVEDVRQRNNRAIRWAARLNHFDTVRLLFDHFTELGADDLRVNFCTVIRSAASFSRVDMLHWMFTRYEDLSWRDLQYDGLNDVLNRTYNMIHTCNHDHIVDRWMSNFFGEHAVTG